MAKALYSGSFDPITLGHLDMIARARLICEHLYVGIGANARKTNRLFSFEETKQILEQECAHYPDVEIILIEGLIADFAPTLEVDFLIRGLRPSEDLGGEMQMAHANLKLGQIETLFLMSQQPHISSTLIRELAINGAPLDDFVPKSISAQIVKRTQNKYKEHNGTRNN